MDLCKKWNILESKEISSGLNTIRFAADCALEIFLATDEYKSHIVLIHLPSEFTPQSDNLKNDNLELIFVRENHCLLIKLLDSEFTGLFDDLIVSLVESVQGLTNAIEAVKIFIETYVKWNVFFVKTPEKGLSKERVIGLWGELSYLWKLFQDKESIVPVNKIIKSWVGPYDAVHDFELPDKSIEIKTKPLTSSTIKISSEYQLEKTASKGLELAVISVAETESGLSLKDLFLSLKDIILKNNGDYTLLLSAIEKETLNEERLTKYCNFKFSRKKLEVFDCCMPDFPKVVRTELPDAISLVKYNLDVKQLASFRYYQENF